MSDVEDLRMAVRDFLSAVSPSHAVRGHMSTDAGYDDAVWLRLATELGVHGIAVPEAWGGAGAGFAELAVVFEEAGAALLCAPLLSTVGMAIPAILNSGDQAAAADYLPLLVDGTLTASLALNGSLDAWVSSAVTLMARDDGTGYRVTGGALEVLDGHTAGLILVAANTEAGVSLFAVDAGADGLDRAPLATLDRTRKIARLTFDETPARLIGADGHAAAGLSRTADTTLIALAAEQVGAAQRCLDMAVAYAKDRIQFGRPIGSFQAVKHRCADMLIDIEGARSALVHAVGSVDGYDLAIAASVAKIAASEAFLHAALDSMKIHGGIGFTWEHDAHLYVRRAKSAALMFGATDFHAERLAELVAG